MSFRVRRRKRVEALLLPLAKKHQKETLAKQSSTFLALLLITALSTMMVVNVTMHWRRITSASLHDEEFHRRSSMVDIVENIEELERRREDIDGVDADDSIFNKEHLVSEAHLPIEYEEDYADDGIVEGHRGDKSLISQWSALDNDVVSTIRAVTDFAFEEEKTNLVTTLYGTDAVILRREPAVDAPKVKPLEYSRKNKDIDFKYKIHPDLKERLCSSDSVLHGAYYVRDFGPECVAIGDESSPVINGMQDLQTSWHKIPRTVQYRDRKSIFLELQDGGKNNPMHLLHNSMFPFAFYHLACYNGKEDMIALLPPEVEKNELLNDFFREMILTLMNGHTRNLEQFQSSPEMFCFPEVRYFRGAYKQQQFGPFLGMECPISFSEEPGLQEECNNFARTVVNFLTTVRKSAFIPSADLHLEDPSRPLNIHFYDRMEQSSRRWKNVNETISRLSDLDNVNLVYIPSFKSSLVEQCSSFHESDIFIMPHGGALANALCSRRNTAIVEIMKKCYTYEEWWLHPIEDALGLLHVYTGCVQPEKDLEDEYVSIENIYEVVQMIIPDVRRGLGLTSASA